MQLILLHILCLTSILDSVLSQATPTVSAVNVPFFTPTVGGGSWFDDAGDGFGEPLNVSLQTHIVLSVL